MAVELLNAYISVSIETSKIPQQVNQALGQAAAGADRTGKQMGNQMGVATGASFGAALKKGAGLVGITGGAAAIAGAFKGAISSGMDFTNSMNTMRAVTSASAAEMQKVSDAARKLGNDVSLPATSANDAALAMVELAKGGFDVQQSMAAAKGTLQLAAAAQIDAATAATIQSQALQAFGKDASFAGEAADILANAANASSAEIVDVAAALQQSGTVANQFGISMQDTAAAIAMFANAGIKGSDAGTLLKSAMLALTDQGKPAQKAIEELGLTVYDTQGKFVGLPTLFGQLNDASKRMSEEQYQAATAVLFGSDAMRLAGVAAEQGKAGFDEMAAAMGKQGSAAEVAAAKTAGLPGAWERVKNSAEEAGLALYDVLQGPLANLADGASKLIDKVVDSLKGLGDSGASNAFKDIADDLVSAWNAAEPFRNILAGALKIVGASAWTMFSGALKIAAGALQVAAPLMSALGAAARALEGPLKGIVAAFIGLKIAKSVTSNLQIGMNAVATGSRAALTETNKLSRGVQNSGYMLGSMTSSLGNAKASLGNFAGAYRQSLTWVRQSNPDISTAGAHFKVLKANVGGASGAMSGLKSVGSGLVSALGGPVGIGLMGTTMAAGAITDHFSKKIQEAEAATAKHKASVEALTGSVNAYNRLSITKEGSQKVFDSLKDEGVVDIVDRLGVSLLTLREAAEGSAKANSDLRKQLDAARDSGQLSEESYNKVTGAIQNQIKIQNEARRAALQNDEAMGGLATRFQSVTKAIQEANGQPVTFGNITELAGVDQILASIGYKVETLPDGQVVVTAQTAEAEKNLALLTSNAKFLDLLKVNPKVGMQTQVFISKDSEVRGKLAALKGTIADPKATLLIDELLGGHQVSMAKVMELDQSVAKPIVDLMIDQLLQNAATANSALDNAARRRQAIIDVSVGNIPNSAGYVSPFAVPPNADGSIRKYANGGTTLPDHALIQKPDPKGGLVQWAEPETGGEAFIPLAKSKRPRSQAILATVARMFGMALVPQDSISGTAGAFTSTLVSALIAKTGVDGITKFADGGLRDLVNGKGASGPLKGSPYVWGGVNWGDCSGAMSALARYVVGLDPFGGRFSTATMGGQLAQMGFSMGRGSSGDLRFGWYNGGPGGGHTAGTLPDGTNVEMGGSYGGGMVGGSVGADHPQFTDHAYLKIGPGFIESLEGAGPDDGGYVTRPDGTIVPNTGTGTSGTGTDSAGSGNTSISGRFGAAAGAFVEGQLADIFNTLYINDTPGALGAIAEYENSQRNQNTTTTKDPADTAESKRKYEEAKLKAKQEYEDEKLKRKQEYDDEKAKLKSEYDAKRISKSEYERKLAELKKSYDETELQKKQEYDRKTLEAKQKYDDLRSSQQQMGDTPAAPTVTDPGFDKPKKGEDTGTGAGTPANESPQDAVKRAFRPNKWDVGQYWADTDWIVGKESGWDPKAQNPSSTAYGLFQFLDETWGTVGATKTDDPFKQGEAGLKYIAQRYGDPSKARAFWEANGWYDRGGVASGVGFLAKATVKPERVLDPRETAAFEKMVNANFDPVTAAPNGGMSVVNNWNITGSNADEITRKVQSVQRREARRYNGRP